MTEAPAEMPILYYLLGVLVLSVGFWGPEHEWSQSKQFAAVEEMLSMELRILPPIN
jgi:hypothetical protein